MGLAMSNPLSPTPLFTVLINNLNLAGNEWLEALRNMSISTRPSQIFLSSMVISANGNTMSDSPSPKRLCNFDEDYSSSSSENSSSRYFLRSHKKTISSCGFGKEVIRMLDKGGRGRKSLILKAQSKLRVTF